MIIKVSKYVKVGGHIYSIWFNEDLKDGGDYGIINHRKQVIEINPLRPESQKVETLIHEFLHFINWVYCNENLTEDTISDLSQGIFQIIEQTKVELDWSEIKPVA